MRGAPVSGASRYLYCRIAELLGQGGREAGL